MIGISVTGATLLLQMLCTSPEDIELQAGLYIEAGGCGEVGNEEKQWQDCERLFCVEANSFLTPPSLLEIE